MAVSPDTAHRPPLAHGGRLEKALALGHRLALMCAERRPEQCHRVHLVAQALLEERGIDVLHIDEGGVDQSHQAIVCRLAGPLFSQLMLKIG